MKMTTYKEISQMISDAENALIHRVVDLIEGSGTKNELIVPGHKLSITDEGVVKYDLITKEEIKLEEMYIEDQLDLLFLILTHQKQ